MPMPMSMGMHAGASTSMPMPTMNVPVVSASVPMHAPVPVHAYSYCRGSAHILSATYILSAIGLHARPIVFTLRLMSAAIIMTMIVPVSAYDAAVDCFVIAGRSLPADIFHDASAHGSAPASMFMFMFMFMFMLMLAASAALASAPMVMVMHASMLMLMLMGIGMGMSMPMRAVIAGSTPLPSSAHASHPLLPAAPRGGATLLCGSLHSAPAPLGGASAFMNRFRTMGEGG